MCDEIIIYKMKENYKHKTGLWLAQEKGQGHVIRLRTGVASIKSVHAGVD